MDKRTFLKFLGASGIVALIKPSISKSNNSLMIKGIAPSDKDDIILADGLSYYKLISWGDKINKNDKFGFNNDFLCVIPVDKSEDDLLLWANHEYTNPLFVSDYNFRDQKQSRTISQVDKEMTTVGGSIVRIKKKNDKWEMIPNDKNNRRLDAKTKIKFNWDKKIEDQDYAIGTHSNCSGGITPWGTFLSCEENYDQFFGETEFKKGKKTHRESNYGWEKFYPFPPEHYGWVVEIDPFSGEAQKHIALGRFAHECCTLQELDDARVVAYSGDDENDEFLYKFISSKKASLKEGELFVADVQNGKWLSLDYDKSELLKKRFKDQTEVLVRVREAARILGASPLDRPEDIEIDPLTGNIIVALTNNKPKNRPHGQILKIREDNNDHESMTFTSETLAAGGEETGFSCPDNMIFDKVGNLLFTVDMSGSAMNNPDKPYYKFKNNGLFVLIRHGKQAGEIHQLVSAPIDAELTGPWFSPDYKTLFLSVQHPGGESKSLNDLTSTWPHDEDGIPKPSVICIEGKLLDELNSLI